MTLLNKNITTQVLLNQSKSNDYTELIIQVVLKCDNEHWNSLTTEQLNHYFLVLFRIALANVRNKIRQMFVYNKHI
jgi:hypothetical protein